LPFLVLALGIAAAGFFVGQGWLRARALDRSVTVKGISERDVEADVAIWPLRVVAADDDLAKAHAQLERSMAQIREFLSANGIDPTAARVQSFSVTDARAERYGGESRAGSRFIITQTLVVRSQDPKTVLAASAKIGDLVAAGVVLSSGGEYGQGGPTFLFTGLNALKPEMIGEATAHAREAAEKFAHDSGSRLGRIRHASQGIFEIQPRDRAPGITEESQVEKTVRVVSTLEYGLED
jgi:hypothetical protein